MQWFLASLKVISRLIFYSVQANEPLPSKVSLMYYFVTDGPSNVVPNIRKSQHLRSLEGEDSELGSYKMSFSAEGSDLAYSHMISYTPGFEHIETVLKYGLEIKRNKGETTT